MSKSQPKRAWLVYERSWKWEWVGRVRPLLIIDPRRSDESVKSSVQDLWNATGLSTTEKLYYATRRRALPYAAVAEHVPGLGMVITCGHEPYFEARIWVLGDVAEDGTIAVS